MKKIKAEKKVEKKPEDSEVSLPNFKGKLDLILRLIRLLINLSIYEGNTTELEEKNKLINEYNRLFDKTQGDLSLKLFNSFYNELTSTLFQKLKSFNGYIAKNLLNTLTACNQFIKNKLKIGELLNQVIKNFSETIDYLRKTQGKSLSSKIINEFYDYLDDISKDVKNLKHITYPKKNKEEEEKLKAQEELEKDYKYSIEKLKEALKKKEKELFSSNEKLFESNLDLNSIKESYEESKKQIENQKKINDEFKQMLEQMKSELDKNKNEYSQKITNLENTFKNANNHLMDANKQLSEKLTNLETSNKQLSKKVTNLENANKQLSKKVTNLENANNDLENANNDLENANKELFKKVTDLEKDKIQLTEKITNLEGENTKNKIKMKSQDDEILELRKKDIQYDKIFDLESNTLSNIIKVKEIEIFNLESSLMKRIQELEAALKDNNINNNNINEGENKENNKILYDKYIKLANHVRFLIMDYKLNHPEQFDDLDKNEYNYDFNFKK